MMRRQTVRRIIMTGMAYSFPLSFLFLSPAIPFEGVFHDGNAGIFTGSLFLFGTLFLISLFTGRLFCGWVCPGGAFQESFCSYISNEPLRKGKLSRLKFVIWAPWLAGLVISYITVGGVKTADFFFNTHMGVPFGFWGIYTVVYMVVSAIIVLISAIAGRRGFCRTVCWCAPFMIIGSKLGRLLRIPAAGIKADSGNCNRCGVCSKKCPMGLDVREMASRGYMKNSECVLCGVCVDACPRGVLKYTIGR